MRAARLLAFALLAAAAGGAAAAPTKTPAPAPDPAPMPPGMVKAPPMGDIVFYVAHGDADACGVGCSEWIAAEGKIDPGAAPRLRRLLAKLGRRRPPILFHSPGGNVAASIELGRLIHDQKFTVSVGHTIPRGCDRDQPVDKACDALKRSGQELPSDFDPSVWMCNSGCVYVVAGGVTRLVPPWVRLGIHDVGIEADRKAPAAALAAAARTAHARLQDYSRDMGIDKALLTASFAIPFESIKAIDRDEIVRYGIDRREFGEDVWRFTDKPRPELSKRFFLGMNSGEQRRYRNAYLGLGCGAGSSLRLVLGLAHDPSDQASADVMSMTITVNGEPISLGFAASPNSLDVRAGLVRADMLDLIASGATNSSLAIGFGEKDAGGDGLNVGGFAAGYAKLQQSCNTPMQVAMPPPPPKPKPSHKYEFVRTALAEQKLRIDSITPICDPGETRVSVLEQPQHGVLTIEDGQVIPCNLRNTDFFYQPKAGYRGPDSVTLNVTYPSGFVATRHYSIEVAVPTGPAPAGESVPQP